MILVSTMADYQHLQAPIKPHFFKPLLPGFHAQLNIPVAFFSKHLEGRIEGQINTAKLRSDASDKTWKVKISGLKFTEGWEDFAVAHDLRIGDFTVFRHEGGMVFHVTALGPSCCEIQYVSSDNMDEDQTNIGKKRVKKDSSDNSCFVAKVSASSLRSDQLYLPLDFARSNGLNKMCVTNIVLLNKEGRSWKLDMKHGKAGMHTYIRPGWKRFCAANGMSQGYYTFKLVRKSGTPIIRLCHAKDRPKSESEFSSHHSFLEGCATPSNLQQNTLYLPKRFVNANGLDKGCNEIILKNGYGRKWSLALKHYDGQTFLKRGWTSFCQENRIKAGDSFKLELVGSRERHVLSLCPAESRDKAQEDSKSEENEEESISKCRASSSYSQNRFVTLTLTLKAFKTYKLFLPRGFTGVNGINKPGKITLVGRDGVKRVVDLFQEKSSGTMRLGKGWREFCEAQGVKIDESFVLELIWEEEASPVLKFCTKLNSL